MSELFDYISNLFLFKLLATILTTFGLVITYLQFFFKIKYAKDIFNFKCIRHKKRKLKYKPSPSLSKFKQPSFSLRLVLGITTLCAICLGIYFSFNYLASFAALKNTYSIGVLLPQSYDIGDDMLKGIEFAVKKNNENLSINKKRFELKILNHPNRRINDIKLLKSIDSCKNMIGIINCSELSHAMILDAISRQENFLHVVTHSSCPPMASKSNNSIWLTMKESIYYESLCNYLISKKVNNPLFIYMFGDIVSLNDIVKSKFESHNLLKLNPIISDSNISNLADLCRNSDAIVLVSSSPFYLNKLLDLFKFMNISSPLYVHFKYSPSYKDIYFFNSDFYCIGIDEYDLSYSEKKTNFSTVFYNKYLSYPTIYTSKGYDAATLIINTVNTSNNYESTSLRKKIIDTPYYYDTTEEFVFSSDGDLLPSKVNIFKLENNRIKQINF